VAQVVGFIKGKSAISIARTYMGRRKNFTGQSFWARGYLTQQGGFFIYVISRYIALLL
jgi:putative transposase